MGYLLLIAVIGGIVVSSAAIIFLEKQTSNNGPERLKPEYEHVMDDHDDEQNEEWRKF